MYKYNCFPTLSCHLQFSLTAVGLILEQCNLYCGWYIIWYCSAGLTICNLHCASYIIIYCSAAKCFAMCTVQGTLLATVMQQSDL
jgi:hypothetical protein